MSKFICVFLVLMTATYCLGPQSSAWAVFETQNGGHAIRCGIANGNRLVAYDFAEDPNFPRPYPWMLKQNNETASHIASTLLSRFVRFDPNFANYLTDLEGKLLATTSFVDGLPKDSEIGPENVLPVISMLSANCGEVEQIISQTIDDLTLRKLVIVRSAWLEMDENQKAIMLVHEILEGANPTITTEKFDYLTLRHAVRTLIDDSAWDKVTASEFQTLYAPFRP